MGVEVKFHGLREVMQNLDRVGRERAIKGLKRGLLRWGEETITVAKRDHVPVVFGVLRGSGQAVLKQEGDQYFVELSFGNESPADRYAIPVHENPRAGKTGGVSPDGKRKYKRWSRVGGWKYLETPAYERAPKLEEQIALEVANELRKR